MARGLLIIGAMNDVTNLLNRVLDATALRSEALASNIANAETVGYRRRDVAFLDELKTLINNKKEGHSTEFNPTIKTDKKSTGVRLESEFSALSENQLLYVASAELLARKYAGIQKAIRGN